MPERSVPSPSSERQPFSIEVISNISEGTFGQNGPAFVSTKNFCDDLAYTAKGTDLDDDLVLHTRIGRVNASSFEAVTEVTVQPSRGANRQMASDPTARNTLTARQAT